MCLVNVRVCLCVHVSNCVSVLFEMDTHTHTNPHHPTHTHPAICMCGCLNCKCFGCICVHFKMCGYRRWIPCVACPCRHWDRLVPHKVFQKPLIPDWSCLGLARTVYIHRIWPYIWWFPCQRYHIYTVYIWFWPTLIMLHTLAGNTRSRCYPGGRTQGNGGQAQAWEEASGSQAGRRWSQADAGVYVCVQNVCMCKYVYSLVLWAVGCFEFLPYV